MGVVTLTPHVSEYVLPSTVIVAVIVAVPAETPVTTPSATVATEALSVVHVTSEPAGTVAAVIVPVASTATVKALGFNVTDAKEEFLYIYGEVGEAYEAWLKKKPDLGEE